MKKYNDKIFYKVIKAIIKPLFFLIYRPKVEGLENIPREGRVLLVGNHTNYLDAPFLASIVKREIHYLAKIELFRGPKKLIFSNMGLIPVDRQKKNEQAITDAIEYLKNDKVVLIFPEGTTTKDGNLLPFKMGAFKIAYEADSVIVPFIINGDYKKKIKIKFLEGYKVTSDIEKENKKLYSIILKNKE